MNNLFDTVVDRVGAMSFQGNITPATWFRHPLLQRKGKPYTVAIALLSDVVYWYRPREERDEQTGQVVARTKRFSGDKLQRTLAAWGDMFGFSRKQVKSALAFLKTTGILTVELRQIQVQGMTLSNVLFVEPVPEKLAELNILSPSVPPGTEVGPAGDRRRDRQVQGSVPGGTGVGPCGDHPQTLQGPTYTETSKTSETSKSSSPQPPSGEPPKKRKGLDDYPDTPGFIAFWKAWPAGNRKSGRKQCRKTWHVANLESLTHRIVAAVEASKKSRDWTKDGGAYIPCPQTWLNQARWEAIDPKAPTLDDQLLVAGDQWKGQGLTPQELLDLGILTPEQLNQPIKDERKKKPREDAA
ncbi:MAG: hypothetical protein ACM359_01865 [Bacillota bacterium]